MKVITSLGGPFVGLDVTCANRWGGNDSKRFVGEASPFPDDYEAAGFLTNGRPNPPCSIASLTGAAGWAFLISMPSETALLHADGQSVHIAQAEYADADWTFDEISRKDFEQADFGQEPSITFRTTATNYVLFDSVYPFEEVDDNRIEFFLSEGEYRLSAALQQDGRKGLIFCKIEPV